MCDQKYVLALVYKDSNEVVLTGKVSTITPIKVWAKKLSESKSVSDTFDITWYPVEVVDEALLEAFDILRTRKH